MKLVSKELVEGCTCEEVTIDEMDQVKKDAEKMYALMNDNFGVAAPQVGIFKRFFIAKSYQEKSKYNLFINPEILKDGKKIGTFREGCLTYPGKTFTVKRPKQVKAEWVNQYGKVVSGKLSGREAQIFQHELDHLNGVTIGTKEEK